MKLELAYYGDPILRKKGKPVEKITDEIRQLVTDMIETMIAFKGMGLAAPQIHQSLALFITSVPLKEEANDETKPGPIKIYINPKLSSPSEEYFSFDEGCLSIPKLYAPVFRPERITVEAMDLSGQMFTEELSDLDARVVMHENDHINGVLYIDRLAPEEKKRLEPKLREIKNKYYLASQNKKR
jgi:peptide deformylase